ncbi:YkuS family protein [Caldisalinibacter kiritimatiensis]|uniref:YkuS family protein n=1 Tax=Caldisalinibacter kiritimatiensis TaxID=1304284 RepID=R1CM48_9FIRM|nr:YkuS family protein [Caldisalinibacter kiritimatiensis]EOC99785.1 hypothetical protein L21TH_2184 [Caldisalinibacter kiritimatiensis]
MPKRIAVQQGLNEIKERLIRDGYEVFDIDSGRNVEAVIYMADGYNIPDYSQFTNMNEGTSADIGRGMILINAKNKSIEEIEYIIENRVYTRIFDYE